MTIVHLYVSRRRWSVRLLAFSLWLGLLAGCSGGGDAAVSSTSNTPVLDAFPAVNDAVFALLADASGGVYVGGRFTEVGAVPRQGLVHILADGSVDPLWAPAADAPVTALLLHDQTVYIGGNFLSVNGVERWRLAAVDRVTGALGSWDPRLGAPGVVNALAFSGATVYVGGVFELINATVLPGTGLRGEGRRNLAAVNAVTGMATPWNPNIFEGEVKALALDESVAYAGGSFQQVGVVGQETIRLDIAAFELSSGVATPWNPSVRGVQASVVYALQMTDEVVYIGGRFDQVGGQARENLAAVDRATGLATGFNVPANDTVFALCDDGQRLYVGGLFTTVGGASRNHLAAIDKATGQLTGWNPNADGLVRSLVVSDGKVFVGGEFTNVGGQSRARFAVIDPETGQLLGE